jgi:glycosyltransferase involved in cell wall biosynthesis
MDLLIVIVPAFNEGASIARTVERLRALKPRLADRDLDLRVYVVDDGSTDETRRVAEQAADRVVRHRTNRGLGAAVRSGLNAARHDGANIAVKFDADLQHEPDDVLALIEPIRQDEADLVYGYRFDRIAYRMPLVRRTGNKVFTALMRWLTKWDIRDAQPGIFAASDAYLSVFRIPGDYNYTQQILLDAFHKGMRFAHVPVAFYKRETGMSFISFKYPMRVLWQIFMVLVGITPMRIFGPVGLLFLTVGAGVSIWELLLYANGINDKPIGNVNLVLGTGLFGLQSIFFGALAQLIIERR